MKGMRMLVGNFELNRPTGPSVFWPLKETTKIYILNIYFYVFSRATLNETFTAKYDYKNMRYKNMLNMRFAQNTLSETNIRNLHP